MKVGLVGYGQIGRTVADAVASGRIADCELVAVLVRDRARARELDGDVLVTTDLAEFLGSGADTVVEVAGHDALRQYATAVLESGKDLLTVCAGAFADNQFLQTVESAAVRAGRRVLIPSGAIAGLDMISAAALGRLETVTHTTRKNPRAFRPEQLRSGDAPGPGGATLLFDGPAREGVTRFPENVNVAAAVSMAGIGLDRTRLRVFADPGVRRNVHQLEVEGEFGSLRVEVQNEPSEKPNTGRVVPMSVLKALRDLSAPIVVGL